MSYWLMLWLIHAGWSYGLSRTATVVICFDCAKVSAGHSCWGILNGPATGKALAELICTGDSHCVDLAPFNPARLIRTSESARQKERMMNYERTHLADLEPLA